MLGTEIARPRAPDRLRKRDRLRILELDRRILAGQPEAEAWASIVTDSALGIGVHRGAKSIHVAESARLLDAFFARVAPAELAESKVRVARSAARFAPNAWARVELLIDDEDSGVALAAAKFALHTIGIGEKHAAQPSTGPTFNGPTNVLVSFAAAQKARANGSS